MTKTIKSWQRLLFSALSGLLLLLSWQNAFHPAMSAWPGWLAFVALIPFILAWRKTGWRGNVILGWLMGFIYFLGVLFWLQYINRNTNLDNRIAWLIFSFLGGCYFALFASTAAWVRDRFNWPGGLVLALSWVAWEYIRGHFITGGWPWGSLGHTQYANPVTRQIAAVAGVGGLSFIIVLINVMIIFLFAIIREKRMKNSFNLKKITEIFQKKPILSSLVSVLSLLWIFLIIINIHEMIAYQKAPKAEIKVALIQGNIKTDQAWDSAYKDKVMAKMAMLHKQAAVQKPYLIIWSESCFPGILDYKPDEKWNNQLKNLIKSTGIPTLLTSNEYIPTYNITGQQYHHYNSAFLLGADGEPLGHYRKIKLVPAGEYIPWNWMKLILHAVVREPIPQDFEPGTSYEPLHLGRLRFSPLICYEDHFEELGYQLAKRGALFFAALANNGWSGEPAMGLQHTTMSVFLAVEHRMEIAKADMTGPTCVIDGWGKMSRALPYYKEGVKIAEIKVSNFKPFFTKYGNIVPFSLTILYFFIFFISFFPFLPKWIENK